MREAVKQSALTSKPSLSSREKIDTRTAACFVDLQLIKGLDDYVRACTMFFDQHLTL